MTASFDAAYEAQLEKLLADVPPRLAESIRYSALAPGKRIRPRLALCSAELCALPRPSAEAAASAIELLHCFTLIHDDLPCMDDDDFRRGQPSNHKKFGEATALLAGDALLALGIEALLASGAAPAATLEASRALLSAIGPRGVIGGQAAEMALEEGSSLESLLKVHELKTARLFEVSLELPAILAQSPAANRRALAEFGLGLGIAFQIVDDLEDEEIHPLNIRHRLSVDESKKLGRARLEAAAHALEKTFSLKAKPLLEISREVLSRL